MTVTCNGQADQTVAVRLDARACLAVQRPDSGCRACADVCATAAISVTPRQVEIAAERCTSCGRCGAACPTGAFAVTGSHSPAPAYECLRVPPTERVAGAEGVACLGGLTEETLRSALAAGDVRLMDRGWCAHCPAALCAAPWADVVARVGADAATLGLAARPLIVEAPLDPARALAPPQAPAAAPKGLSRRQLFSRLAPPVPPAQTKTPDALALLPGQIAPPRLAARLGYLRVASGRRTLEGRLFPAVAIPATADLPLVAGLCPTAALSLHALPQSDVLTFDAARCLGSRGCRACLAAGAIITPEGEGSYEGPAVLIERSMADCPKCDARFAPVRGARVCEACRKDTELASFAHGLMRRAPVQRGA